MHSIDRGADCWQRELVPAPRNDSAAKIPQLAPVVWDNLWRLCSPGSRYHNMGGFFGQVKGVKEASAAFDAYVTAACVSKQAICR